MFILCVKLYQLQVFLRILNEIKLAREKKKKNNVTYSYRTEFHDYVLIVVNVLSRKI